MLELSVAVELSVSELLLELESLESLDSLGLQSCVAILAPMLLPVLFAFAATTL